jgi:hypothetical protein
MVFIQNKYTDIYYSIISNAQSRELLNDAYIERHHIIPKSLGGNNEKSNLVSLTAKEHYLCHLLLPKMTSNSAKKKMLYALYCITHVRNKGQVTRYIPSARQYVKIKNDWRESIKGRATHNKGKPMSAEQKEKLRQANLGKTYMRTDEYRAKMSATKKGKSIPKLQGRPSNRKGVTMTDEQKEKIKLSMLGKNSGPRSEETIKKMSVTKRRICRLSDRKEMSVNSFTKYPI